MAPLLGPEVWTSSTCSERAPFTAPDGSTGTTTRPQRMKDAPGQGLKRAADAEPGTRTRAATIAAAAAAIERTTYGGCAPAHPGTSCLDQSFLTMGRLRATVARSSAGRTRSLTLATREQRLEHKRPA